MVKQHQAMYIAIVAVACPLAAAQTLSKTCKNSGYVCRSHRDGETDYCQRWQKNSVCFSGKCYTPANCNSKKGGSSGGDQCVDLPFKSKDGQTTCLGYEQRHLCTPDGGYGSGWDRKHYGTFRRWAINGVDATQACCACGGGKGGHKGSGGVSTTGASSFDLTKLRRVKSLGRAHTKGDLAFPRSLDFSPDHNILASCSQNEIKIWSVAGGKDMKLLTTLTKKSDFEEVVFIDDHLMASASSDSSGGISLWRMNGRNTAHWVDVVGRGQQVLLNGGYFESAAFDSTLRVLAIGDIGGKIELWAMPDHVSRFDYRRLRLVTKLSYAHGRGSGVWPRSLAFSSDHKTLASASTNEIKIWTVKSSGLGSLLKTIRKKERFTDLAFISSNIMLSVSSGGSGGASLWKISGSHSKYWKDIEGSGNLKSFSGGYFESVAYDPVSHLLAIGDISGKIEMWVQTEVQYSGGWQKKTSVYCPSSRVIASHYSSRARAESACKANAQCVAISDTSCDGRGNWKTCATQDGSHSSKHSCMYAKPQASKGMVEYNLAQTNSKCESKITTEDDCIAAAKALGLKDTTLTHTTTQLCAGNAEDEVCSARPQGCIYQEEKNGQATGYLQFNKAAAAKSVPCGARQALDGNKDNTLQYGCVCSSARKGWTKVKGHYCSGKDSIRSSYQTEAAAQSACNQNPDCKAISDTSCDGKGTWVTCRDLVGSKSSMGSCMYDKPSSKLWTRVTNRYCASSSLGKHATRAAAEKACAANPRCKSIYDSKCDSQGVWYSCDSATGKHSGLHSCLYVKPSLSSSSGQSMPRSFLMRAPEDSTFRRMNGATFKKFSRTCFGKPVYQAGSYYLYYSAPSAKHHHWVLSSKKYMSRCSSSVYAYADCAVLSKSCKWKESHKGAEGWVPTTLQLVASGGH